MIGNHRVVTTLQFFLRAPHRQRRHPRYQATPVFPIVSDENVLIGFTRGPKGISARL